MDKRHLDIIVCPITRRPLALLDSGRLEQINAAIAAGRIRNHAERALADSLSEALITDNSRLIYPVIDGIPVLLEEESIDWNQMVE